MTTFSDDFNRADSSNLGAGWVEVSGDWSIVSNQLSPGAAGGTIILRAAGAMSTNDNSAQFTIAATTAASQGVWCRGSANISDGYLLRNNGTSWDLFSVIGGSFTVIGTYAAAAAPGDVAKVQAIGSAIKGFINGVQRISVTNTGVTSGVNVGIRADSVAALRFDDFTGADASAAESGQAAASFGGLSAGAVGVRTVVGSLSASFSGLDGEVLGVRDTAGSATAEFGALRLTASGSGPEVAPVGSWSSLVAMVQEAADIDQHDRSTAPTSCATCYTALREGPNGTLYCPWDGLKWPEDASSWGEFPGSY